MTRNLFGKSAVFVCAGLILTGCATHHLLQETPVLDVNLPSRERVLYEEMLTHILPEGLVVYMKRPPGTLRELYRQGAVQADGAFMNGCLLAMLSLKHAVTRDPVVRALALRVWSAHHRLVTGSGYEGLVARSFGKRNPSDTGLVFRRDGSGDGLMGWVFGTGAFVRLLAGPCEKKEAAADLRAVVRHLARHDLDIHQGPDQPTPYGNFRTPRAGISVGHLALGMMALAALARKLNPHDEDCRAFFDRLLRDDYPAQTENFYAWFPHHADNCATYAMNLVTAHWFDTDTKRSRHYAEGARAFWRRTHDWQMAFYALVYRFVGGRDRPASIRDAIDRLANMPPWHHQMMSQDGNVRRRTGIVPIEQRPQTSFFWSQNVFKELTASRQGPLDPVARCRLDFLLAYWFGRYVGEYSGGTGPG